LDQRIVRKTVEVHSGRRTPQKIAFRFKFSLIFTLTPFFQHYAHPEHFHRHHESHPLVFVHSSRRPASYFVDYDQFKN
jgi:hypothetical protein